MSELVAARQIAFKELNHSWLATRDGLVAMEEAIRDHLEPENVKELFPLVHRFAGGIYAREILMPAGGLVVGKIHRDSCINVITKGCVSVMTEEGEQILKAPITFISPAGAKRAVFAHEDTVWTTFHIAEEKDPEEIIDEISFKTYAEYDAYVIKKLGESQ